MRYSFVIPVYDRTREVREAIKSCLNQIHDRFEVIVVLDGSPIETRNTVSEFSSDDRVRVFSYETSSGNASRGRNRGILEANGEFVCFLDSDDLCDPKRLACYDNILKEKPNTDVLYGAIKFLVDGSRAIPGISFGDVAKPKAGGFEIDDLLAQNQLYTLSVAVKKRAALEAGGFRISQRYQEDYEFWLRLANMGCKFWYTDFPISIYRVHQGNAELNYLGMNDMYRQQALENYQKECNDVWEA